MKSRRIVKDINGNIVQGAITFTGEKMNPENPILKYFKYEHLPENLQEVSADVCELARKFDRILPNGPEKSTCLRKLLEAKDCAVRTLIK